MLQARGTADGGAWDWAPIVGGSWVTWYIQMVYVVMGYIVG